VEGERKEGGERERVEFSFSEEQGAERCTHALHARWIDRHQTLSTRFVWSLLLTGAPVSRGLGHYCTVPTWVNYYWVGTDS
jgi:hypothetical protein